MWRRGLVPGRLENSVVARDVGAHAEMEEHEIPDSDGGQENARALAIEHVPHLVEVEVCGAREVAPVRGQGGVDGLEGLVNQQKQITQIFAKGCGKKREGAEMVIGVGGSMWRGVEDARRIGNGAQLCGADGRVEGLQSVWVEIAGEVVEDTLSAHVEVGGLKYVAAGASWGSRACERREKIKDVLEAKTHDFVKDVKTTGCGRAIST